jgi:hypothetical protein
MESDKIGVQELCVLEENRDSSDCLAYPGSCLPGKVTTEEGHTN